MPILMEACMASPPAAKRARKEGHPLVQLGNNNTEPSADTPTNQEQGRNPDETPDTKKRRSSVGGAKSSGKKKGAKAKEAKVEVGAGNISEAFAKV